LKRYLDFINESADEKEIFIYHEKDLNMIKEGVEIINASSANLNYFPELPKSLKKLFCRDNNLKYIPELPNGLKVLHCDTNKLKSLPKLPNSLKVLYCGSNKLSSLPELPNSLIDLECSINKLKFLPKLPNNLENLYCYYNKLTSLPELPENLTKLSVHDNPLEYPIPHKFQQKYLNVKNEWMINLIDKLSSYEHQKQLIDNHGIYIMKKYINHPELINDKIKEENPTYLLSVEYGF